MARGAVSRPTARCAIRPQFGDKAGVGFGPLLAEIGQRAGLPKAAHQSGAAHARRNFGFGKPFEHRQIDCLGAAISSASPGAVRASRSGGPPNQS
jgi:hypothetical protein